MPSDTPPGLSAGLESLCRRAQIQARLPSLSATVARGGEVVFELAAGLASAEPATATSQATQYRIGSITKTFTAAAVMKLRDEDRLALDDDVGVHVPEFAGRALTLRRMLSHLGGLQREPFGHAWESYDFPTIEDILAQSSAAEQVLPGNFEFHYSNLAYALLGEVVARRSGMPFRRYVEEKFLRPLGLSQTTWSPRAPAATGYFVEPYTDRVEKMPDADIKGFDAAGQLWSTTGDVVRWGNFLIDPEPGVLSPSSAEEMRAVHVMQDRYTWRSGYGLGLMLTRVGDTVLFGHSGGMPGFIAGLIFDVNNRTAAAVLTNASGVGVAVYQLALDLVARTAEEWPREPDEWRPRADVPPEVEPLLGRWWSEGVEYVFRYRDGRLEAAAASPARLGVEPAVFEQVGPERYRTVKGREHGEWLELVRDDSGRLTKLYWASYPFTRQPSG